MLKFIFLLLTFNIASASSANDQKVLDAHISVLKRIAKIKGVSESETKGKQCLELMTYYRTAGNKLAPVAWYTTNEQFDLEHQLLQKCRFLGACFNVGCSLNENFETYQKVAPKQFLAFTQEDEIKAKHTGAQIDPYLLLTLDDKNSVGPYTSVFIEFGMKQVTMLNGTTKMVDVIKEISEADLDAILKRMLSVYADIKKVDNTFLCGFYNGSRIDLRCTRPNSNSYQHMFKIKE